MIDKQTAIKFGKLFVDSEKFLSEKLGGNLRSQLSLYEFIETHPDPAICEAINQYLRAQWHLRRYLQENPSFTEVSDPAVRAALKALAAENADEAREWDSIPDERIDELAAKLLWDWWGPSDYVFRYLQTKPLISVSRLPARLLELVNEARQCYGFGQPNAVMALGRMILEFAITDIGVQKRLFPAPESLKDYYKKYPPFDRADRLLKKGSDGRKDFRKLFNTGSKIIHSSKDRSDALTDALTYLCNVLEFVSNQYAIYIRS